MNRKAACLIVAFLAVSLPILAVTGTAVRLPTGSGFTETGVTVGDGNWIYLHPGRYSCFIWADVWTDGNVDVEKLIRGATNAPTKVADVEVGSLVDATADAWGNMGAGQGYYRIEVEGSDTVNWQCLRYEKGDG